MTISAVLLKLRSLRVLALAMLMPQSMLEAQVVQLPTTRNFSYSGSMSVPDGGTGFLGGNSTYASGSTSRGYGPYSTRSRGVGSGGTSASINVQIIDLAAMDEALLTYQMPDPPAKNLSSRKEYGLGGKNYLRAAVTPKTSPRNPYEWQRELSGNGSSKDSLTLEADIRYYLEKGRAAEKANHIQAARVYYEMAAASLTPEIIARYNKILADQKAQQEANENREIIRQNVQSF